MFKKILILSVLFWGSFTIMAQDKQVAILDPIGNVTSQIKDIVREEISSSFKNLNGYTALVRSQSDIDNLLSEYEFRMSELSDNAEFGQIGKLIGANYVFVTNISPISGNNYHISCKVIDVFGKIYKQETAQTTRGGLNDLIVVVQKTVTNMFQAETELTLQGRKIFANNIRLDDNKVKGLMANTDALKYYNKSKSQRKTGTALVWTGVVAIVAGIGFDLVDIAINESNYDYVLEDGIIYEREVIKLRGTVIGGAVGATMIGTGIVLHSSSNKSLQKSVDTYNSAKKTAQYEIKFGVTGNGIGLAINF